MKEEIKQFFGYQNEYQPSLVNNPFSGENITSIGMYMSQKLFGKKGEMEFSATVHFKNGDTSGSQEIKGDNFADLYKKVANFCMNI